MEKGAFWERPKRSLPLVFQPGCYRWQTGFSQLWRSAHVFSCYITKVWVWRNKNEKRLGGTSLPCSRGLCCFSETMLSIWEDSQTHGCDGNTNEDAERSTLRSSVFEFLLMSFENVIPPLRLSGFPERNISGANSLLEMLDFSQNVFTHNISV